MPKEAAMPNITSPLGSNRNRTISIDRLEENQGHASLASNGGTGVASMDVASFDWAMSLEESAQRREMAVCQGLMRGCADLYEGKVSDAKSVLDSVCAKRGRSHRSQS